MKKLNVKTTDCSCDKLIVVAKKCGFGVFEGSKHCKVTDSNQEVITTIPRHKTIDKYTVKGILERFREFGADININ